MASKKIIARYVVVAAVIVTVVTSLWAMFRTSAQHDRDTLGPTRIAAANDGGWWVISHHHLHRFDREGQRSWKISLSDLGISSPAAGLGVLSDGRVLLSEPGKPDLRSCDFPARTCEPLSLERRGQSVALRRVALLQGVGNNRFVISDDFGRRLMLADENGEVLAMRTLHAQPADRYEIAFQPRLSANGELLLPDRKTQQVQRLSVDSLEPAGEPLLSAGEAMKLPLDAARGADGRWWVINTPSCICSGQIVQFDPQGTRIGRLPIREFGDPRALALIDAKLVIADQYGARLGVYDIAAGSVSEATGAAFLAELVGVVALRAQGNVPGNYLLGAVILVPFLGIGALLLLGERLPVESNPMVPLQDARHDHFDREAVSSLILARLPPGAFKSRGQFLWLAFRREPYQWVAALAILLIMIANEVFFD